MRSGTALAGLALSSRFLNEEMRAQTLSAERLAAVAPGRVRLSLNENPFGPPPSAIAAMQRAIADGRASRYPYLETHGLVERLAAKEGVSPGQIVLGVGSGEILETVGVHFGPKGGEVVYAEPGYLQLPRAMEAVGGRGVTVPVNARQEHDLPAMAAKVGPRTAVAYVVNPHNPTGTVVNPGELEAFVRDVSRRALVLVDEAYLELADPAKAKSVVHLVSEDRPLLVARTFSKIYGLAGLRIGYAVTSTRFAAELRRLALGTLNTAGVIGATACLEADGFVPSMRATIAAEREKLLSLLRELRLTYAEPQTNFVFFRAGRPQPEVAKAMADEGVIVARAFPPMTDWIRLTIGLPEENTKAREALRKVLTRP